MQKEYIVLPLLFFFFLLDCFPEAASVFCDLAKCNVDDNQDLAMKFGVMSIPTLVVFKNGEEIDRSVGALPKARLQALLEKHL